MYVSDKESFFSSDEEEVSSYKRSKDKSRDSDQGNSNVSEHDREKETETGEDISQEEKEPTVNIIPMHHLEETLENMINKKFGKLLTKGKSNLSKSKRKREDSTDEEREKRKSKKKKQVEISSESDESLSSLPSESSDSDDDMFIINEHDEVGKAIKKSSSKFLQKRFKNSIRRDSLHKILKNYKTPSNATFLKAKKTNKEVWSKKTLFKN